MMCLLHKGVYQNFCANQLEANDECRVNAPYRGKEENEVKKVSITPVAC